MTALNVTERRHFETQTGVLAPLRFVRHFSAEECAEIRALGRANPFITGTMSTPTEGYRDCELSRIQRGPASEWLYARLTALAEDINAIYGFDIDPQPMPPQFTCYGTGGKIDWHVDYDHGQDMTRKISLSVQLSPRESYRGGALEFFPTGEISMCRGLGTAVAFPAILAHRVTPVTEGTRDALVAWFVGPRLR